MTYFENIRLRIEFLNGIYSNLPSNIELEEKVISKVWDEVVLNGLTSKEKDILYRWYSEVA